MRAPRRPASGDRLLERPPPVRGACRSRYTRTPRGHARRAHRRARSARAPDDRARPGPASLGARNLRDVLLHPREGGAGAHRSRGVARAARAREVRRRCRREGRRRARARGLREAAAHSQRRARRPARGVVRYCIVPSVRGSVVLVWTSSSWRRSTASGVSSAWRRPVNVDSRRERQEAIGRLPERRCTEQSRRSREACTTRRSSGSAPMCSVKDASCSVNGAAASKVLR